MKIVRVNLLVILSALMLSGCQAPPKFNYPPRIISLNGAGPSIQVNAIIDNRTNRAMDKVLEKGYLLDVQRAISAELESLNLFSAVVNATSNTTTPPVDFILCPQQNRLEWEIPNYGTLLAKGFTVGLLTGGIGGTIYLVTGIDVLGHSELSVRVEKCADLRIVIDDRFNGSVTNRIKKAACDTPKTKSEMMGQAFQQSMQLMKPALAQELSRAWRETTPPAVSDVSLPAITAPVIPK